MLLRVCPEVSFHIDELRAIAHHRMSLQYVDIVILTLIADSAQDGTDKFGRVDCLRSSAPID